MIRPARTRGPRNAFPLALAALGLGAATAFAQDPPPRPAPDTIPADTVRPAPPPEDTVPPVEPEAEPPPEPPAVFPRVPATTPVWSDGVWVWDREALLAAGPLTLTDLLERLPGVLPIRSGFYPLPEAAVPLGATAGRIEVVLDGYVLDPIAQSTFDLARLELMHLRTLRVERRLDGLRIEIDTIEPEDPRPFSMVEAGTGDLATNIFRGLFLAPRIVGGSLSLGIERLSSEGILRSEPGNNFTGWAKWALVRGSSGIELELRQNSIDRRAQTPWPLDASRRDLIARARTAPVTGLLLEAFAGRSSEEIELNADTAAESSVNQFGGRAVYRLDAADVGEALIEAGIRSRDAPGLPELEARLLGAGRLGTVGGISADLTHQTWAGSDAATSYQARIELGPFFGVRPFGSVAGGRRGVPHWIGPPATDADEGQDGVGAGQQNGTGPTPLIERSGWRGGLELSRGRLHVGLAALDLRMDSVPVLGLPFDSPPRIFPGGSVNGWEATARVPVIWDPLWIELSHLEWTGGDPWIYMPPRTTRAALVYQGFPMDSPNLEVFGRLEASNRSEMLVPHGDDIVAMPAGTLIDFHLQVRILDVRIFYRLENVFHNQEFFDLPDRARPGQRSIYGVKWQFWN